MRKEALDICDLLHPSEPSLAGDPGPRVNEKWARGEGEKRSRYASGRRPWTVPLRLPRRKNPTFAALDLSLIVTAPAKQLGVTIVALAAAHAAAVDVMAMAIRRRTQPTRTACTVIALGQPETSLALAIAAPLLDDARDLGARGGNSEA
jgi:hypothetical protein